jgi:hypothetical protein
MALSITLAALRDAVRDRSDTVGSARVTDPKLTRLVNSSIRRLYAKAVAMAEDDFTGRALIATDSTGSYAELPTDFLTLRAIGWVPGEVASGLLTEYSALILTEDSAVLTTEVDSAIAPGNVGQRQMRRFQLQERWKYDTSRGWNEHVDVAYRLIGPQGTPKRAEFLPPGGSRGVVVLWYVPEPLTLSADADLYYGRSGFEEWVILDAAAAVLIAEESDASQVVAERERIWQEQIRPIYAATDQAQPDRVVELHTLHTDDRWLL